MTKCSRSTCFAPESTCDLGNPNHANCPAWRGHPETSDASGEAEGNDELLLPWSGSALGPADFAFVAARNKPLVVGIAGPENAGKTTLLAAWYLLIGRGLTGSEKRRFAGSYSLLGWEAVAGALRWSPGHQPGFPLHTSSRGGRAPGLLHLAFRESGEEARSYLFTDAPGEWFRKWAVNPEDIDGQGARWVAEHADVFLLVADCEALAGGNRGLARVALKNLAERLAAERADRPVALVWTKSDAAVTPEMSESVSTAVRCLVPDVVEFTVSIKPEAPPPSANETPDQGQGLLELLDWTLGLRRKCISLPSITATSADPLFLFGIRQP